MSPKQSAMSPRDALARLEVVTDVLPEAPPAEPPAAAAPAPSDEAAADRATRTKSARRPAPVAPVPAPPDRIVRFTAELPRPLHRKFKDFTLDEEATAGEVNHALVTLLVTDEAIADRVRKLIRERRTAAAIDGRP